jgi:hypothetical protein
MDGLPHRRIREGDRSKQPVEVVGLHAREQEVERELARLAAAVAEIGRRLSGLRCRPPARLAGLLSSDAARARAELLRNSRKTECGGIVAWLK